MRLKNLDLITAICIAVINVGWTQLPNRPAIAGIVQVILALPLTFILPGYTLTQILLRRRASGQSFDSKVLILRPGLRIEQPIGAADNVVLSLGLSMAIDVLVGFTLNIFPVGLQALSWSLSLGLLTTLFAVLAALLRRKENVKVAKIALPHVTVSHIILCGLAILITTAALWLAIIRPLEPVSSFTQFWMLPAKNNSCEVSLGIQSFESTPVTYLVKISSNNVQVSSWSSIALVPRQEWLQSVPVEPGIASALFIEARLYRTDKPGIVYRTVHLTFHVVTSNRNGLIQKHCTLETS